MQVKKFQVVGISIRTTNENAQSSQDIPKLWQRFFSEYILEKIPNKINNNIYCVYSDYEKDYTKPYTVTIGCAVKDLSKIPEGMIGKTIDEGEFAKYTAKDRMDVFNQWVDIWKSNIDRSYITDFELYSEKPEVDIFVAIK